MRKVALSIALLSGCTPPPVHHPAVGCLRDEEVAARQVLTGRWFDVRRVGELQSGDSTVEDAMCVLGRPTTTSSFGDMTTLMWSYGERVAGRQPHLVFVTISFNAARVMLNQVSVTESGGE